MNERTQAQPGNLGADAEATKLLILRLLAERPELSQRELSLALGVSLGKTHYLLHALLDKGLLKVRNFRRSDHKLAYAYLLTPAGLRAKLQLTRNFLSRKEAEFETLWDTIASLRAELGQESGARAPAPSVESQS
jgi:EPS-associated MarR family transcriptional regulator